MFALLFLSQNFLTFFYFSSILFLSVHCLFIFQISCFTLSFSYSILPSSFPFLFSNSHFEIYFSFLHPFSFLALIISPPSSLTTSFFFPLVISYSFYRSNNNYILFPPLLIFSHSSLISLVDDFPSILFLFVQYFFIYFKSHISLFPCLTLFCLLPSLSYFQFKFSFFPFLHLVAIPHSCFSFLYLLKIIFLFSLIISYSSVL